jgi:hypothetical protein
MSVAARLAAACCALAIGAAPAAEEHGKIDVFAGRGVAIAWAVARGPSEDATFVVMRVVTDPAVFPALSVTGRDPFTKAEHEWVSARASPGRMDVRIPRARFADFPRTELRFFAAVPESAAAKPELVVFYLGIPDTTPEFNEAPRLEAYLDDRVAKARAATPR